MSRTTISWTDHTINPGIYGCSPAGPGCTNCYAAGLAPRLVGQGLYPEGITQGRRWTGKVIADRDAIKPAFAKLPKRKPARVFITSMGDLFHEGVPFEHVVVDWSRPEERCDSVWAGLARVGVKRAGRLLDGLVWNQVPEAIRCHV